MDYDTVNYRIHDLVDMFNPRQEADDDDGEDDDGDLEKRVLFVGPDYRRKNVWSDKDRSAFIESLLLDLPAPFLIFGQLEERLIEIVDGVQRIRALDAFVNDNLALRGLTKLTALNNFHFSDLDETTKRKFRCKFLRIALLSEKVRLETRLDFAGRLNKSGRKVRCS